MTQKEGAFDMGNVSEEDPAAVAAAAVAPSDKPAKKARKAKAEGATAASDAEPKAPKVPQVGEYGKRGLPTWSVTLVEGVEFGGDAAKHHQRVVIYELLAAAEGGTMSAGDLITTIENDPTLLARMNTNQPIMRCVAYQVNELCKRGVATNNKPERAKKEDAPAAEATKAEAEAA